MIVFLLLAASVSHLRQEVAATALAQLKAPDPAWHPQQRDCAGLVRFSYRAAFRKLQGESVLFRAGPWKSDFADAETLLQESFVAMGRDERAELSAESGDLLAFSTDEAGGFHLMMLVRGEDRARTEPMVIYSPGNKTNDVRVGGLQALKRDAPQEWRPVASNARFLGFYRFKEWARERQ